MPQDLKLCPISFISQRFKGQRCEIEITRIVTLKFLSSGLRWTTIWIEFDLILKFEQTQTNTFRAIIKKHSRAAHVTPTVLFGRSYKSWLGQYFVLSFNYILILVVPGGKYDHVLQGKTTNQTWHHSNIHVRALGGFACLGETRRN